VCSEFELHSDNQKGKTMNEQHVEKLKALQVITDRFKAVSEKLEEFFGGNIWDCEFGECVTEAIDLALVLAAETIGITPESLSWFVWENDFGKKKLSVCIDDQHNETVVDSIETFLQFEVEAMKEQES